MPAARHAAPALLLYGLLFFTYCAVRAQQVSLLEATCCCQSLSTLWWLYACPPRCICVPQQHVRLERLRHHECQQLIQHGARKCRMHLAARWQLQSRGRVAHKGGSQAAWLLDPVPQSECKRGRKLEWVNEACSQPNCPLGLVPLDRQARSALPATMGPALAAGGACWGLWVASAWGAAPPSPPVRRQLERCWPRARSMAVLSCSTGQGRK